MINAARAQISALEYSSPTLEQALVALRQLSLDEFGEFLLAMPNEHLPRLSEILPKSTPDAVQKRWTGNSGGGLLRQSTSFINFLVAEYTSQTGKPIADAKILDFGVGYGRLMRLLPYYTNPENLYGIDPWQESLDHALEAKLLGQLALSQSSPTDLPFPGVSFDLAYAFSIFTHISAEVAAACLAAVRRRIAPDGVFLITVRPEEFWDYLETQRKKPFKEESKQHANTGYAFLPSSEGSTYGDTSMSRAMLEKLAPGWRIARMGSSFIDPQQVFVTLRPA